MKFFKEFKEFISKGNILDLAVAVILGGAFSAIVTALTNKILMPIINLVLAGGGGLENARTTLGEVIRDDSGAIDWEKTNYIDWGAFIAAIIDFLLIAQVLFIIIKLMMKSKGMLTGAIKKVPTKAEKQALRERGVDLSNREEANKALLELRAEAEQAKKDKEAADKEEAYRNSTEGLLKEIRDLLKDKDGAKENTKAKDKETK